MDFSPYCGYFLDPNECVGCNCMDEVGGFAPTTPQLTTPQALLVKEEAARLALLLVVTYY